MVANLSPAHVQAQMRTLEMNQNGISTAVGKHSAQRSWDDIRSVSEEGSHIIIPGRNSGRSVRNSAAPRSKRTLVAVQWKHYRLQ
jgi:hypothetical protein